MFQTNVTLRLAIAVLLTLLCGNITAQQNGILYTAVDTGDRFILGSLDLQSSNAGSVVLLSMHHHGPNDRIRDLLQLADGSIASLVARTGKGDSQRSVLQVLRYPSAGFAQAEIENFNLAGLDRGISLTSAVVVGNDLYAITGVFTDTPPFTMAKIDSSGQVRTVPGFEIPPTGRISNLARCPDGNIYASGFNIGHTSKETPNLLQVDVDQGRFAVVSNIQFIGQTLWNDVRSLTCSPSNTLFALADPSYSGVNSLFVVDAKTGELTFVQVLDVDKISFGSATLQ